MCPSGAQGVARCLFDRRYSACECDLVDGGALADGGTSGPRLCTGLQLAEGCRAQWCLINAPLAEGGESPVLEVTPEQVVDPTLALEFVEPRICVIRVLDGSTAPPSLRLTQFLSADIDTGDVALVSLGEPRSRLLEANAEEGRVRALVPGNGRYGPTRIPPAVSKLGPFGNPSATTATEPGFYRDLQARGFQAAFTAGERTYVANGRRILVYEDVVPEGAARPSFVLGQPALDADLSGTSSALFAPPRSLWADGTRLMASTGSRVLTWTPLPRDDLSPASLVLGQSDFAGAEPNAGGRSAGSLDTPAQIDVSGDRLAIGDMRNNRVLTWDEFPTGLGQPASGVVGQPRFDVGEIFGGETPVYQTWGVLHQNGGLWVAGYFGRDVYWVPSLPRVNPAPAHRLNIRIRAVTNSVANPSYLGALPDGGLAIRDLVGRRVVTFLDPLATPALRGPVLGQPGPDRVVGGPVDASTIGRGQQLASGGGMLWLEDGARLLGWRGPPRYHHEPADVVLGQPGFASRLGADFRDVTGDTLAAPADVAVAPDGRVAVADRANSRVLLYGPGAASSLGARAATVLGQRGFGGFTANDGGPPTKATLSGPAGVALNGGFVAVADTENHRVLVWRGAPSTGRSADLVLGQRDAEGSSPNGGAGDLEAPTGYADADARGLFRPTGVALSGTRLAVADRHNHRVLVWDDLRSARDGEAADHVLGQESASGVLPNRGRGARDVHPDGFHGPTDVLFDGGELYVADAENNRVVRWDLESEPHAVAVYGQPDLDTVEALNFVRSGAVAGTESLPGPRAANMVRPWSIARIGADTLVVSEYGAHRVHLFAVSSGASLGIIGQPDDVSGGANAGGISARSFTEPMGVAAGADGTRLWVSDPGNHRVLVFSSAAAGEEASGILGQRSFVAGGFNQSSEAAGFALADPSGLAMDGDTLLVADRRFHRVLRVALPLDPDASPLEVLGQPNGRLALPNAGRGVGPETLREPAAVAAAGGAVAIADAGNHRVVLRRPDGATVVLGQSDGFSDEPNGGAAAGASTLRSPSGVATDGRVLVVADTANSRVLVWRTLPTRDGVPADGVFGQADFAGTLANAGRSVADAGTLSLPAAVLLVGADLWVADTGNNRLVVYRRFLDGPAIGEVLGQPSPRERRPAATVDDTLRLAGPVTLAQDGAQV
ncbi:MAG: NHL repeat-containing protein, partial [Myxococcota bacterium]